MPQTALIWPLQQRAHEQLGLGGSLIPRPPERHGAARFALDWLPVLLYLTAIFVVSAQPNLRVPLPFPNSDKLCHLLEYGGLGLLLARALRHGGPLGAASGGTSLLLGMITGAADELFQRSVPGRVSSPYDWAADTVGLALAILIYGRSVRRPGRATS